MRVYKRVKKRGQLAAMDVSTIISSNTNSTKQIYQKKENSKLKETSLHSKPGQIQEDLDQVSLEYSSKLVLEEEIEEEKENDYETRGSENKEEENCAFAQKPFLSIIDRQVKYPKRPFLAGMKHLSQDEAEKFIMQEQSQNKWYTLSC